MIESAAELTQFFNRDSSDALQPTADAALTKFLDKPDQIDPILQDWQAARREDLQGVTVHPDSDGSRPVRTTAGGRPADQALRATRVSPLILAFVLVPFARRGLWVFWPALQGFWFSLTELGRVVGAAVRRVRQLRRHGVATRSSAPR